MANQFLWPKGHHCDLLKVRQHREFIASGSEFLFNGYRLNVAISRAQTLGIVLGSPALVRTSCSKLDQMRLVNVYCRAVQEGAMVATAPGGRP